MSIFYNSYFGSNIKNLSFYTLLSLMKTQIRKHINNEGFILIDCTITLPTLISFHDRYQLAAQLICARIDF